jgi:hypothetical protein
MGKNEPQRHEDREETLLLPWRPWRLGGSLNNISMRAA